MEHEPVVDLTPLEEHYRAWRRHLEERLVTTSRLAPAWLHRAPVLIDYGADGTVLVLDSVLSRLVLPPAFAKLGLTALHRLGYLADRTSGAPVTEALTIPDDHGRFPTAMMVAERARARALILPEPTCRNCSCSQSYPCAAPDCVGPLHRDDERYCSGCRHHHRERQALAIADRWRTRASRRATFNPTVGQRLPWISPAQYNAEQL